MYVQILIIKNQQLFANAIFFTELIMESTLFHKTFFLSPLYIFMYVKKLIFGNQQLFIHAFVFCWLQNDVISIS